MIRYETEVEALDGTRGDLTRFRGRVMRVANTASQCGFTPQYRGLEDLHRRCAQRGLAVLACPCNPFGQQEPGTSTEIQVFCAERYDVTSPVFARIEVHGPDTHPLIATLKAAAPGALGTRGIKWNFTRFLVDREGRVVRRFAPFTRPVKPAATIEARLP